MVELGRLHFSTWGARYSIHRSTLAIIHGNWPRHSRVNVSANFGRFALHQEAWNLSKAIVVKHQLKVESLISVVHVEWKVTKIQHKEVESPLQNSLWRKKENECLVGTFKG